MSKVMVGNGRKLAIEDPQRAERLWLAMAVATLWTLTVGGDVNQHLSDRLKAQPTANHEENKKFTLKKTNRQISCFLQGLLTIIADLLNGKGISLTGLFPVTPPVSVPIAVNTS